MFSLQNYIGSEELEHLCAKYHIKKISLFGSALQGELKDSSDIDLLVEFEEGKTPGLITFCKIENEFSDIIGRKIDLRTPYDLSGFFRDDVVKQAKIQYAG